MKILKGNLIELAKKGEFDVIIHGCNCFNTMGAGIAKQIKDNFPDAYTADLNTKKGDINKLGNYSIGVCFLHEIKVLEIVNAYTQYKYGKGEVNIDYDAVESCFKNIYELYKGEDLIIGYPMIGCGLAGGDWNIVSKIIDKNLKDLDHYLVIQ